MGSVRRANVVISTPDVDKCIKSISAVKTAVERFAEMRVSAAGVRSLRNLEINRLSGEHSRCLQVAWVSVDCEINRPENRKVDVWGSEDRRAGAYIRG